MNETTISNQVIPPFNIEEAIKLLEESEKGKRKLDDDMPRLIAALANQVGWETMACKFLPKGKVFVGTGGDLSDLFKAPVILN
jgi:hypothetical protein